MSFSLCIAEAVNLGSICVNILCFINSEYGKCRNLRFIWYCYRVPRNNRSQIEQSVILANST